MKLKRRQTWIALGGVIAVIAFAVPIGRQTYREWVYKQTISGEWGCGSGPVEIVMHDGVRRVRTSLDTARLLGETLDADDLVARVERRIQTMRGKPEVDNEHEMTRAEYELVLSARLLAQAKHPRALELNVQLLDDPYFLVRGWAASTLGELRDPRALPYLHDAVRSNRSFNGALIPAIEQLGDPASVDVLLETFSIGDGLGNRRRLEAIETLTGASTGRLQQKTYPEMGEVFERLDKWWSKNREAVLRGEQPAEIPGRDLPRE